jgi:hypothetical protein
MINLERNSLGSRIGYGSVMESVPVTRKTTRGRPTGGTKLSAAQGRERRAAKLPGPAHARGKGKWGSGRLHSGKLSFSFFSICFQNLLNRVSNPNQIK